MEIHHPRNSMQSRASFHMAFSTFIREWGKEAFMRELLIIDRLAEARYAFVHNDENTELFNNRFRSIHSALIAFFRPQFMRNSTHARLLTDFPRVRSKRIRKACDMVVAFLEHPAYLANLMTIYTLPEELDEFANIMLSVALNTPDPDVTGAAVDEFRDMFSGMLAKGCHRCIVNKLCAVCREECAFQCAGCGERRYCGRAHQRHDWTVGGHRNNCVGRRRRRRQQRPPPPPQKNENVPQTTSLSADNNIDIEFDDIINDSVLRQILSLL